MRVSFGFVATIILIFAFFVVYALVSPAWDTWYQMGLEASSKLSTPMTFLNWCWKLLPIEVIFCSLLWFIVAGMGEAANPGKLLLGQIVLIVGLVAMQLLYVTVDPIVGSWFDLVGQYAGIFAGVSTVISVVWYNYCFPVFFAILVWVIALSISTEAETRIA